MGRLRSRDVLVRPRRRWICYARVLQRRRARTVVQLHRRRRPIRRGGMLQQPLRIPVTGTTPWASSFADKLVRGIMGAYAGPGSSTLDKRAASSRALEGSSGPERPVLWAVV